MEGGNKRTREVLGVQAERQAAGTGSDPSSGESPTRRACGPQAGAALPLPPADLPSEVSSRWPLCSNPTPRPGLLVSSALETTFKFFKTKLRQHLLTSHALAPEPPGVTSLVVFINPALFGPLTAPPKGPASL